MVPSFTIQKQNIKQTLMGWCWKPMDTLVLAQHAKDIGLVGIEGIDRKYYPEVKKIGLGISLVGGHGFSNGPCNPKFRDEVIAKLAQAPVPAEDLERTKTQMIAQADDPSATAAMLDGTGGEA